MKKFPLFSVVLLCVGILFVQVSPAQDYTRRNLPEGALARLGKGPIHTLAHSSDGTRLAVASSIGIWIYDAHTGAEIALLTGHTDWIRSVSFSPDGRTLASGSVDRTVRMWDVVSGQEKAVLQGHEWRVNSVSFSPDGQTLASGSTDGTILLWDMSPYITRQSPDPDFDGDGTVGFPDFLLFVAQFGPNRGDAGYDARYDLDGDGSIGFGDFLIFANAFGKAGSSN